MASSRKKTLGKAGHPDPSQPPQKLIVFLEVSHSRDYRDFLVSAGATGGSVGGVAAAAAEGDAGAAQQPQVDSRLGTGEGSKRGAADPQQQNAGGGESLVVGRLEFELATELAPKTCENFKQLCVGANIGDKKNPRHASYSNTSFLRVTDTIIQGGDTANRDDGKGQDSIYGALFDDEALGAVPHDFGVLSMVNSGPNTNGTQFFVCMSRAAYLDQRHVSFGRLVNPEGEQLLRDMQAVMLERCGPHGMMRPNSKFTSPFVVSAAGIAPPPTSL